MATQRNYLINTTTISTTASGTTIGSGNTTSATFELARTLVRSSIPAGAFSTGSQTWAVHYVVSAMSTPYEMRLKVQRRNSSGVMQAESTYGSTRSTTGTYDDSITADLGTWAANDQLALVWEHRRPSGTGSKNGTIDANGSSYIDAPITLSDVPETLTDNLAGQADADPTKIIGQLKDFTGESLTLADAHTEVLELRLPLAEDANLLSDYFVYGKRPRWQDSFAKTLDEVSNPALTLTLSDDLNAFNDAYDQVGPLTLTFSDSVNAWADYFTYGRRPRWQDSISAQQPSLSLSLAESIDNLADAYAQIEDEQFSFAESINNLADDETANLSIALTLSDDALNLNDSLAMIEGQFMSFAESVNDLADAITKIEELRPALSDSFTLTDFCGLGYGLACSDANTLNDAVVSQLSQALTLADVLSLSDSIGLFEAGFLSFSDSFTLTDSLAKQGDQLNTFSDSFTLTDAYSQSVDGFLNLSDSFTLTDHLAAQFDYFLELSESAFYLSDAVTLAGGSTDDLVFSETLDFIDGFEFALGLSAIGADDLNNWQDLMNHNMPFPAAIVRVRRDDRTVIVEP